jgi:Homeodomain-like domain
MSRDRETDRREQVRREAPRRGAKADACKAGEGWSDSQIASALETTVNTVARTRQRLVEAGFEAALTQGNRLNVRRSVG